MICILSNNTEQLNLFLPRRKGKEKSTPMKLFSCQKQNSDSATNINNVADWVFESTLILKGKWILSVQKTR